MHRVVQVIKDDVVETVLIVKICFTSFWFWLPVLYGAYITLQIWLMFAIHPLTIMIVPAAVAVYAAIEKEKRLKSQYGIEDKKPKAALHPYSLIPQKERKSFEWVADKSSEDYERENDDRDGN